MDPALEALADQHAETASLVHGLTADDAQAATRCTGWSVTDVLLHLAQSDELAIASLKGGLGDTANDGASGWVQGRSVDESVADMVTQERGAPFAEVIERWTLSASGLRRAARHHGSLGSGAVGRRAAFGPNPCDDAACRDVDTHRRHRGRARRRSGAHRSAQTDRPVGLADTALCVLLDRPNDERPSRASPHRSDRRTLGVHA